MRNGGKEKIEDLTFYFELIYSVFFLFKQLAYYCYNFLKERDQLNRKV